MLSDERLAEIRDKFTTDRHGERSPTAAAVNARRSGINLLSHIDAQAAELTNLRAERERLRAAVRPIVEALEEVIDLYERLSQKTWPRSIR